MSIAAVVAVGVILDCATPILSVLDDETALACRELRELGLFDDPLMALAIALAAVLATVIVWRSAYKRWLRRRRVETTGSLVNNIHRLDEASPESEESVGKPIEEHEIWERIDELEKTMRSGSSSGRDVAPAWLGLLRTANDMHTQGQLSTDDFKSINTRLLGLVSEDSDRTKQTSAV